MLLGHLAQIADALGHRLRLVVVARPDMAELRAGLGACVDWEWAPAATRGWFRRSLWERAHLARLARAHGAETVFHAQRFRRAPAAGGGSNRLCPEPVGAGARRAAPARCAQGLAAAPRLPADHAHGRGGGVHLALYAGSLPRPRGRPRAPRRSGPCRPRRSHPRPRGRRGKRAAPARADPQRLRHGPAQERGDAGARLRRRPRRAPRCPPGAGRALARSGLRAEHPKLVEALGLAGAVEFTGSCRARAWISSTPNRASSA
jgi:hypothetical protein